MFYSNSGTFNYIFQEIFNKSFMTFLQWLQRRQHAWAREVKKTLCKDNVYTLSIFSSHSLVFLLGNFDRGNKFSTTKTHFRDHLALIQFAAVVFILANCCTSFLIYAGNYRILKAAFPILWYESHILPTICKCLSIQPWFFFTETLRWLNNRYQILYFSSTVGMDWTSVQSIKCVKIEIDQTWIFSNLSLFW